MVAATRAAFCIASLVAAWYSAVWARAAYFFGQGTEHGVSEAVRLVPGNAVYVAGLAAWDSTRKTTLLTRAVQLNPFDSEAYIQLGLHAELQNQDPQTAERFYLEAENRDRTFVPKWTLTNFYFRRQNTPEFLRWAKETLEITPYSPDPVFTQMWLLNVDASVNERAIPDRPPILLGYASFLSSNNHPNAIPAIVNRLAAISKTGRDDVIAPIEDRLLAENRLEPALEIWRTLNQAGWIQSGLPSGAHPLVNGDFVTPIFNHGFDWMLNPTPGVAFEQRTGTLSIALNGTQPDECSLLQQYIVLQPNESYKLNWSATSSNIDLPSGLTWQIGAQNSRDLLNRANQTWNFVVGQKLMRLTLQYKRSEGRTRTSGRFELRSVSMQKD